jgi:hypothetical protein
LHHTFMQILASVNAPWMYVAYWSVALRDPHGNILIFNDLTQYLNKDPGKTENRKKSQ